MYWRQQFPIHDVLTKSITYFCVTNRNCNSSTRRKYRDFSSVISGAPGSLEVKGGKRSDGLLHSFYAVFRFPRGVNRLLASSLVKISSLVCPREHQAVVLHAISPISTKLCQFKRSTPKLKKTNWFSGLVFSGGR